MDSHLKLLFWTVCDSRIAFHDLVTVCASMSTVENYLGGEQAGQVDLRQHLLPVTVSVGLPALGQLIVRQDLHQTRRSSQLNDRSSAFSTEPVLSLHKVCKYKPPGGSLALTNDLMTRAVFGFKPLCSSTVLP